MTRTIDDINEYNLFHGHKRIGDFEFTDSFIEKIKAINELKLPEIKVDDNKPLMKHILKKHAYAFFNDYYKLHDIGYLPDNKAIKIKSDKEIETCDDIAEIYNKSASYIDPFKLPTIFDKKDIYDGVLNPQIINTCVNDNRLFRELLPKLDVYFTHINLPMRKTEITTANYVHEITHTQLESQKGIIEEYYNSEVLSIFNELFYLYSIGDKKAYTQLLVKRINDIFDSFTNMYEFERHNFIKSVNKDHTYNEFDYHSDLKYTLSTLKAIRLLPSVMTDDMVLKYHTINLINKVFNGNLSVEELLDKVEIDNENILNPDNITRSLI